MIHVEDIRCMNAEEMRDLLIRLLDGGDRFTYVEMVAKDEFGIIDPDSGGTYIVTVREAPIVASEP